MERLDPTAIEKVGKRLAGMTAPGGTVRNDDAARVGLPNRLRDTIDQRLCIGLRPASHVPIGWIFAHDRVTRQKQYSRTPRTRLSGSRLGARHHAAVVDKGVLRIDRKSTRLNSSH